MHNGKRVNTPMTSGHKFTGHGSGPAKDVQLYRSIFGALQYTMIARPEIRFNVNKVCQFI